MDDASYALSLTSKEFPIFHFLFNENNSSVIPNSNVNQNAVRSLNVIDVDPLNIWLNNKIMSIQIFQLFNLQRKMFRVFSSLKRNRLAISYLLPNIFHHNL